MLEFLFCPVHGVITLDKIVMLWQIAFTTVIQLRIYIGRLMQ